MKILTEILVNLDHELLQHSERPIRSIEYDSRKVKSDSLYVARRGTQVDGHDFIQQAIERGASAIVLESEPAFALPSDLSVIKVKNSHQALALLAHAFYDFPARDLSIVGVTGTNGKTTCATLLHQLLGVDGETVGMIGTTGNKIGAHELDTLFTTPEAPELCALFQRMSEAGVRRVVMEVSSHALVQSRVLGIDFKAALFTNLSPDHLDFHGDMQSYADAKKILFDSLSASSIALVNADDAQAEHMLRNTQARCIRVGHPEAQSQLQLDYCISSEQLLHSSTSFQLNDDEISSPLVGRFNIDNLALCLATCIELGFDKKVLLAALPHLHPAPGRLQRLALSTGAIAIVDYAHSPDALEKALTTCRELLSNGGEMYCVFGCGGDRDRLKRPVMGAIAERLAEHVILTSDNPRTEDPRRIIDDIRAGMSAFERIHVIEDRRKAIELAVRLAKENDCILVAGKGHERYQIIGKERLHFDDCEVLEDALRVKSEERF